MPTFLHRKDIGFLPGKAVRGTTTKIRSGKKTIPPAHLSVSSEGVTYHFVVRAFDGELESADSEEVSYTPSDVVPNQPPSADAGQNQTVYENESVTLDGSGSSDSDGSVSAYQWVQTGGTGVSIENATAAQASFTLRLSASMVKT
jgi:hypothetical protein